MKPLIGLNLDVNVQKPSELRVARSYCDAVEAAGCVPAFLPPMSSSALKSALRRIDGAILIGGRDYAPATYGDEVTAPIAELHEDRQEFDLRLAAQLLALDIPTVGICGGMQLLNIALGGSLIQDIPTQFAGASVIHRSAAGEASARHAVSLARGSKLARIYRRLRVAEVVTSHHQCVKRLGTGVRIVGTADDGVPEAIEVDGQAFVVGVQWHPERGLDANLCLFRALAREARLKWRR